MAPKTHLNLIGGRWVPARTGKTFQNINPARKDDVVLAGGVDVLECLSGAGGDPASTDQIEVYFWRHGATIS